MSMYDRLFGSGAANMLSRTDQDQQDQLNNAYGNFAATAGQVQAAQQASAFNHTLNNWNRNPFAQANQWMFNGKPCTLNEFADAIWPGEHEDKLVFLLTYSGPDTK